MNQDRELDILKFTPSPVWAQLEVHEQRPDYKDKSKIDEHFDFVFLCILDKAINSKEANENTLTGIPIQKSKR